MKKKIVIVITAVVAILLAAVVLVIVNNSFAPEKEKPEEVIYKEPTIKELKLKSISTKDKNISIDDTVVYFTLDNRISQLDLEIKSKTSLEELYLLIEFELDKKVEKKVIYQQHVEKNKEFQYMIQSIEDLTKTKKWKVSKITEKEAISNGYIKIED